MTINKPIKASQYLTPLPDDTHLLIETFKVLEDIAATSSKKEKEAILSKNKDSEYLLFLLKFLYDKHIKTGIALKKFEKDLKIKDESKIVPIKTIESLIPYLSTNNTGKDEYIYQALKCISQYPDSLHLPLKQLVTKSYKCGITSSTVNKSIPDLITSEFKIMKGKHLNKDNNEKHLVGKEFIQTLKYDGYNCTAIKESDTNVILYSPEGRIYEGLVEIEEELKKPHINPGVYAGEIITTKLYKDYNDCFQTTSKAIKLKGIKTDLQFKVFDYIESIDCFNNKRYDEPYKTRLGKLTYILKNNSGTKVSSVIPLYIGKEIEQIYEYNDACLSLGEEGTMIYVSDAPYERKRTNTLFKLKQLMSFDLKLVGLEKGKRGSKFENTIGAIVVDYKGNHVSVGSGLTDELREVMKEHPATYIGKIVEIECMGVSSNQDGSPETLRQPRFKRFRDDNKEISED